MSPSWVTPHACKSKGQTFLAPNRFESYRYDAKSSRFKGILRAHINPTAALFSHRARLSDRIRTLFGIGREKKNGDSEPGSPIPLLRTIISLNFRVVSRSDETKPFLPGPLPGPFFSRNALSLPSIIPGEGLWCVFVDGAEAFHFVAGRPGSWNRFEAKTTSWPFIGKNVFVGKRSDY